MRVNLNLQDELNNPSHFKIRRTCIKLSKNKDYLRSPLKDSNTDHCRREKSIEILLKCKEQLDNKNQKIIKRIE